ncbi:MAG: nucleotide exchange factor GrpE [Ignavibacteriales bacterium]
MSGKGEERKGVFNFGNIDSDNRAREETTSQENQSSELKVLQDEIESKTKEYNDLYNKYLMVVADLDNYKKRVAKEKADIAIYGNEELIKELLHVLDNLERALEHSESAEETGPIIEGIKLVYKQFLGSLDKFGVRPISATRGERFDPKLHQAIERVESDEIAPGLIISEMLRGYMLRDRLLRPSLVVVSKEKEEHSVGSDINEKGNSGSEEVLDLMDEESE